MDARRIVAIGGGRVKAEDPVDHAVGYECLVKIGDKVDSGQPLAVLYGDGRASERVAAALLGSLLGS